MRQGKVQVVGVRELSDWLSLSPRRLQQLKKRGVIPVSEHGQYRLKESIQAYLRFLRHGDDKPDLTDWRNGFAKLDFSALLKGAKK